MLKLTNVSKQYGKQVVLNRINIDFDNPEGVYGILGRNGVGKTTLMKMIFNMITNYQGDIMLDGIPVKNNNAALEQIVFVGGEINQNNSLFQGKVKNLLKAYEMMYDSFDREFAENMLNRFEINLKDKFIELSTGNKTLVQNTIGLATRTPITILDEPTNGLDSVNRKHFFEFLMEDYANYPRMFILSTHLIQEVENYLTNVVILKEANVLIDETLESIQSKAFVVSNVELRDKNILNETKLGTSIKQEIYDNLTNEEIEQIKSNGGTVESLDLQSLFNALVDH